MGELIALNHAASFDYGTPDAGVIERLEWLLAEAKSGNVRGLICGAVEKERTLIHGYAGCAESHCMVAVASKVFHQIMSADAQGWETSE